MLFTFCKVKCFQLGHIIQNPFLEAQIPAAVLISKLNLLSTPRKEQVRPNPKKRQKSSLPCM